MTNGMLDITCEPSFVSPRESEEWEVVSSFRLVLGVSSMPMTQRPCVLCGQVIIVQYICKVIKL